MARRHACNAGPELSTALILASALAHYVCHGVRIRASVLPEGVKV